MQISILLISILVLTIINIFFVQCRYSLSKINNNDLQEIESKSNLALNRCKKIKAKEKEFLSETIHAFSFTIYFIFIF